MGKRTKNEKGFSAVEGIIIIVIVALLGAGGYLVYKNQHKTSNPTAANTPAKTSPTTPTTSTTTPTPYADWQTYKNDSLSVGFSYPADWKVTTKDVTQDVTYHYIYVESPDFVAQNDASAIPTPKQGAAFGVYMSPNKFGWKSVAEATKDTPGFSSPTSVKVDGIDGITGAPSYNSITTRVLRSDNYVDLSYYYVDGKKDSNLNDYQHWLSTMKLSN